MITIDSSPNFEASLSASGLTRFLNRARLAVGLRGEVDVLLTSDHALRQLNKSFRGKDKPTDVLSFPAPTQFATKHAGDLAISLDTAARQASAYGHTLRDEVRILLLHGLLHLSGEDHETDNGEMATREASLRRELRLPTTLIERTTKTSPKPSSPRNKKSSSRPKTTAAEKSPHLVRVTPSPRSAKVKRGSK
jgi:probable rRNA maturation factor